MPLTASTGLLTGFWLALRPRSHSHATEFGLLLRRQLVLEPNAQAEMEAFDLTLSVQHLIELGQGWLFIYRIGFHCLV